MTSLTPQKLRFYLLFPNIFGYMGGIQVYSAALLRSLQDLYPNAEYDVFLKYDSPNSLNLQKLNFLPQTRFHYFGRTHGESNRLRRYLTAILSVLKMFWLGLWQRPNLIITTHLDLYSFVFEIFKRFTGIPYWVTLHGLEAWNLQNKFLKFVLTHANHIIAVSHYTRDRVLQEQSFDATRITVLPNTFDASRFRITPKPEYLLKRYGLSPTQPVILTVSRLDRNTNYKGYNTILESLVEVRKHIPNVHYILVGKGDNQPQIEVLIKKLNLQECVTLTGFVPEQELCDHYNLCNVFALPSTGEGFGIVYLEALACGKPVLAGNTDGSADPLLHGELGCLVSPNDVSEVAKQLIHILQGTYPNPVLYQPEQLREKVIALFELHQFQQQLSNLILKVAK